MQKRLCGVLTLVILLSSIGLGGRANTAFAQNVPSLNLLQPVTGEVSSTQPEQRWSFTAKKGQLLSLRMQATSGDLEPYMELMDSSGKVLATSTNTSLHNATVDGFTIPDNAEFTVRATRMASGQTPGSQSSAASATQAASDPVTAPAGTAPAVQSVGPTNGTFTLWLLPGFSFLLLNDPSGMDAPMRTWRDTSSMSHFVDGKLELSLSADNAYTFSNAGDRAGAFRDLYMQADVQSQLSSSYWEAGLLLRGAKHDDALQFYIFLVNSDSKWKVAIGQPGGMRDLTTWAPLPFISQTAATVGVMIKDNHFIMYYDGQPLSDIADDTLNDPGTFGVVVGTGKAPDDSVSVRFDNFVVTLPADETSNVPVIVPDKLTDWQRAQDAVLTELTQARLIPGLGKTALEIKNKAFVTNNTAGGIVVQTLAGTLSFTDLVYSSDVTWESSNENIACGLELRAADDNNFAIVYLDRKGGYGIRQVSQQDGVTVSVYNLSDAINKKNLDTNRVTIIAVGNSFIVYINGTLIANLTVKQTSGGVRIAAYNYQRASSTCQFTNLWLRSFDK